MAVDAQGRRSAGGTELPDGVGGLRLDRPSGTQVRLRWTNVTRDVQGQPLWIKQHNVYGRASVLPRAECGTGNRLASGITGGVFTMNLPGGTFYTWHVLAEDAYGGESVW